MSNELVSAYMNWQDLVLILQPGDLIEICHSSSSSTAPSQHWAVYVGKLQEKPHVIHFARGMLARTAGLEESLEGEVQWGALEAVANADQCRKNNELDQTNNLRSRPEILQVAKEKVGERWFNSYAASKHFAHSCRYFKRADASKIDRTRQEPHFQVDQEQMKRARRTSEKSKLDDEIRQLRFEIRNALRKTKAPEGTADAFAEMSIEPEIVSRLGFKSKLLADFSMNELIGRGPTGLVVSVKSRLDCRNYAVKRITVSESPETVEKLLTEVRAMAMLDHPAIRRCNCIWFEKPPVEWQNKTGEKILGDLGLGSEVMINQHERTYIYLQLQRCQQSLEEWLIANQTPESRSIPNIYPLFAQILSGLAYLHRKTLVHRNLKPSNVMFVSENTIKICDMGYKTTFEHCNKDCDTDLYTSPEQLSGKSNSKSDIFSLGLISAELSVVLTPTMAKEVFDNFRHGRPNNILTDLPDRRQHIIFLMTNVDQTRRPNCEEIPVILENSLRNGGMSTTTNRTDLFPPKSIVDVLHVPAPRLVSRKSRNSSKGDHTEGKYQCPLCPARYHRKSHLTPHMAMHQDIKNFKCPQPGCDQAFFRKDLLNRHINGPEHANIRDIPCPVCSKMFRRHDNMAQHVKHAHPNHDGMPKGQSHSHNLKSDAQCREEEFELKRAQNNAALPISIAKKEEMEEEKGKNEEAQPASSSTLCPTLNAPAEMSFVKIGHARADDFMIPASINNQYRSPMFLGSGAYGTVYGLTSVDRSKKHIAVKRFTAPFENEKRAMRCYRELQLLRGLNHENIVKYLFAYATEKSKDELTTVYLVTEFAGFDLGKLLELETETKHRYTLQSFKKMLSELLRALKYLNSANVVHRDLKPDNLAIDEHGKLIVLGKYFLYFGCARATDKIQQSNTANAGTSYYRPIEAFSFARNDIAIDSAKVDIWSIGAILSEMITGRILFKSYDSGAPDNAMARSIEICGPIPENVIFEQVDDLASQHYLRAKSARSTRIDFLQHFRQQGRPWLRKEVERDGDALLDFIDRTLVFDQRTRLSVDEALAHPFLAEVRIPSKEISATHTIPDLGNRSLPEWKQLIWDCDSRESLRGHDDSLKQQRVSNKPRKRSKFFKGNLKSSAQRQDAAYKLKRSHNKAAVRISRAKQKEEMKEEKRKNEEELALHRTTMMKLMEIYERDKIIAEKQLEGHSIPVQAPATLNDMSKDQLKLYESVRQELEMKVSIGAAKIDEELPKIESPDQDQSSLNFVI